MMSEKVSQHPVSKFYLKQFAAPEGDAILWEYTKGWEKPKRVSPRKATAEDHFYSRRQQDGSWDYSIEDALGIIENAAADPLKALAQGKSLDLASRNQVAYFMALMFLRVERVRDFGESEGARIEQVDATLRYIEIRRDVYLKTFTEDEIDEFIRTVKRRGYGITIHDKFYFDKLFERADRFAGSISMMNWRIERAAKGSFFITSDTPVYVRRPQKPRDPGVVGIERDDLNAELCFPLSPNAFLLGAWHNRMPSKTRSSPSRVLELNRRTVITAHRRVYSPEVADEVAELVLCHGDDNVSYRTFSS